jgi:hypothetical protein
MEGSKIEELLRKIAEGNETALEVSQELLGEGGANGKKIVLVVQQRKVNPEPPSPAPKAPSPKRLHTFFDAGGFARYLGRFGGADTVILADPAAQSISAVLDEQSAVGFEVVRFEPLVHPLFVPWAKVLDLGSPGDEDDDGGPSSGSMPLARFVQFIVENRRQIVQPSGRDLGMTLQQVRMSKKVELQQGFGAKSVNGLMVETNITGAGPARTEPVDLPDTIIIRAPLYVATPDREMEIDLSLSADERTGVMVRLVSGDVPVQRVEAFDAILKEIKEALGATMTVGMGKPNHGPWDLVTRSV